MIVDTPPPAPAKKPKREPGVVYPGKMACGHCGTGRHSSCVVATENGDWSLTRCGCGCPPSLGARCLDCGERNPLLVAPDMHCVDRLDCEAAIAARLAVNPIHQVLQQALADKRRRQAEYEAAHPELTQAKQERLAGLRQSRPTSGSCLCCGGPTKGGLFLPGHDARLVARLARSVDDGGSVHRAEFLADARRTLEPCSPALKAKFERKVVRDA